MLFSTQQMSHIHNLESHDNKLSVKVLEPCVIFELLSILLHPHIQEKEHVNIVRTMLCSLLCLHILLRGSGQHSQQLCDQSQDAIPMKKTYLHGNVSLFQSAMTTIWHALLTRPCITLTGWPTCICNSVRQHLFAWTLRLLDTLLLTVPNEAHTFQHTCA